jgi:prepilin-type N-terminal cleavage/methylation domain-containing protein
MSHPRTNVRRARGFSLVELMVALAISAMLLTATLGALDASWKSYKITTESASTHVISRIVMTRLLALIRTGSQFGPYPADVLDPAQNPIPDNHSIEFLSDDDRLAGNNIITRVERRDVAGSPGEYELWYVRLNADSNPATIIDQRPMLRGVREALFILEYDPGPRLKRATIDLTIQPNEDPDMKVNIGADTPAIRLVASAVPKQIN